MSELDPNLEFFNYAPHPNERASVYIGDGMTEQDREAAEQIARIFYRPDKPIESTVVLIPVAANQDADHVFPAMREYARQRNCDPFTVCLLFNYPLDNETDGASENVEKSTREIARAIDAFPHLDIRAAGAGYSSSSTIGEKRGDLWNGAFMAAYVNGKFDEGLDVIGLNHDIDTMSMSPHYISRVQSYYARKQARALAVGAQHAALPPVGTRVSHAVLPTHPHVGMVTRWIDNTYFQHAGHASYEAGIAIPFSHYAQRGGFNNADVTHETSRFAPANGYMNIAGAQLVTSPRRYIDRVGEHGPQNIWTNDTFGPADSCRTYLRPDITKEHAEDIIVERMHNDIHDSWLFDNLADIFQDFSDASLAELQSESFVAALRERVRERTQRQLAKAERLLRHLVGSEILAAMARDSVDIAEYSDNQVNIAVSLNTAWLLEADCSEATVDNRGGNL